MAWANEPGGSRVDADLRWQLGVGHQRDQGPLGERESRVEVGIAATTSSAA